MISGYPLPTGNSEEPTIYQNFGRKLVTNNINIISFNYDLILDNILKNTGLWSIATGYGFNIKGLDLNKCCMSKAEPKSATIYLKLHGSLNWGRSIVPDPYIGNEIVVNAFSKYPDIVEQILPIELTAVAFQSCTNMYYETFIVPPILSKDEFYKNNVLQYLWYKAKEQLKLSEEIFVIGYSFPFTDYLAEFLFRQSIAGPFSKKEKKVVIVNTEIDTDYKQRVENIFQNCEFEYHKCDVVEFLRKYAD